MAREQESHGAAQVVCRQRDGVRGFVGTHRAKHDSVALVPTATALPMLGVVIYSADTICCVRRWRQVRC